MQRLTLVALLCLGLPARAVHPADILPRDVKYDPAVPRPEKHLGFAVGERHLYHHQLVGYLKELARSSSRVRIQEYARSHGDRPLVLLTITSPDNHKNLERIRQQHLQLADPRQAASVKLDGLPAVVLMGYSVHGNEPSAGNAAALVAYHLAAATGEQHERLLREVVVLLDPCLNPDGFERFAHWVNNNRGARANPDPEHREHREGWPTGRTNYYWFDLNRDWLPAQHPETQGRLAVYQRWKPNLVLDFHEMGSNSTFFFQPGVPRRTHPLIPPANQQLTRALARYHAAALDRIGSLYFTEEAFDDYYPGKGSTYPDLHGGVGILFEQASSRGHLLETVHGKITFAFTIRNQFQTSLSSLRGLLAMRLEFLEYKRAFYRDSVEAARKGAVKAHVVAAPGDPARLHQFLEVLHRHDIRAYALKRDLTTGGRTFRAREAFLIPTDQPETRFLQALFETRTEFADKVFYDVSTWTLPLAFHLQHATLTRAPTEAETGQPFESGPLPGFAVAFGKEDLAYAIDWRNYHAPRTFHRLLAAGVKVRVATAPFRADTADGGSTLGHGTLLVPLGIQPDRRAVVVEVLRQGAAEGVPVYPLRTGLTSEGLKLGSSALVPVPAPRVLLVTGEGVSTSEAGEVWHLLDQRVGMPVTLVEGSRLGGIDLARYTAVVLVSGTYTSVSTAAVDRLRQYVERGGTLVAIGTAIPWLNARKVVSVALREAGKAKKGTPGRRPYGSAEEDAARQLIAGAILRTKVDHTHPIGFGFAAGEAFPVFRNNQVVLEPPANPYSSPVVHDDRPLLSGYVSEENLELLAGSASVAVVPAGTGRAILLAEDPNFRGFWYGTNRLFLNALFFGPVTRVPGVRSR